MLAWPSGGGRHALRFVEGHSPFATVRTFLGVLVGLTDHVSGSAHMLPKPGRVDKIVAAMRAILRSNKLPSGVCVNLGGKVEYTTSSGAWGRVGRAPLSALRAWQHRKSKRHEDESWGGALRLPLGAPPGVAGAQVLLRREAKKRRPVIVYTDAMYYGAKTPAGMVGDRDPRPRRSRA